MLIYGTRMAQVPGITAKTYTPGNLTASSSIYCAVTSGSCGTVNSGTSTITVDANLTATISGGTSPVCYNTSPGIFTAAGGGGAGTYTYLWYKNGVSTGVTTQTYNPGNLTANTTVYCAVSSGNCGTVNTTSTAITVDGNLTATISGGTSPVCSNTSPGTFTATGTGGTGAYTYLWYANGISTGVTAKTYSPTLSANTSIYCAITSGTCGTVNTSTTAIAVQSAPAAPGSISGAVSDLCHSTAKTYAITAVSGSTSYTWTVPTGASITTNTGTSITVNYGNGFTGAGYITVKATNGCGSSAVDSLAVSALPVQPGSITGITSPCKTQTADVYSIAAVTGATSYTWSITGGAAFVGATTGTSVTVTYANATVGPVNISVKADNACGSSASATLAASVTATCTAKDNEGETRSTGDTQDTNAAPAIHDLKVYPNPTSGQFNLEFSASANQRFVFQFVDVVGGLVATETYLAVEGNNLKVFDMGHLAHGIYFLNVAAEGVETKTVRIAVQ